MNKDETFIKDLGLCTVIGKAIKLPPLDGTPLEDYTLLKNRLLAAGGTYKRSAFVFSSDEDAQSVYDLLMGGEVRNVKKETQFFATPSDLADCMVEMANIQSGQLILEPSAGDGAILEAIYRWYDSKVVKDLNFLIHINSCETFGLNITKLKAKGYHLDSEDFMKLDHLNTYDKIIANPPFSKGQDLKHVAHMFDCLKPGGRLVTVMMSSVKWHDRKIHRQFRSMVDEVSGEWHNLPEGTFSSSGSKVQTVLLLLNKPKDVTNQYYLLEKKYSGVTLDTKKGPKAIVIGTSPEYELTEDSFLPSEDKPNKITITFDL